MNFAHTNAASDASPAVVYPDVIALLSADHRKAEALFAQYEQTKESITPHQKFELAKKVCGELLIHMAIEEGIFYPAVRRAIRDDELMEEAQDEHESAKQLIIQLGEIQPDDPLFDSKIASLADQIDHHVQDEESVMFPKVLVSDVDLIELGKELLEAKNNMRTRLGLPVEQVADEDFSQRSFYFAEASHSAESGMGQR
ncbi:MAG: hemerythrin domain-containing protein [Burkholderiales bacterium]|nr:hemerythrin domain-containing protein [Burkholderiales bacterium]